MADIRNVIAKLFDKMLSVKSVSVDVSGKISVSLGVKDVFSLNFKFFDEVLEFKQNALLKALQQNGYTKENQPLSADVLITRHYSVQTDTFMVDQKVILIIRQNLSRQDMSVSCEFPD